MLSLGADTIGSGHAKIGSTGKGAKITLGNSMSYMPESIPAKSDVSIDAMDIVEVFTDIIGADEAVEMSRVP